MEQPKNGQVNQPLRRRPASADAETRTTHGSFHSHALGLAGSQGSPNTRESSYRPTPNGDHVNGPSAGSSYGTNNTAWRVEPREGGKDPRTAWELPELLRPLPVRKRPTTKRPRLLPHYAAVVEYIYANRYATASQVQRRLSKLMRSYRTAQHQLASLATLGYLKTVSVRSTAPNFPFVYFATGKGVRLITKQYEQLGQRWQGAPTEERRTRGQSLDSVMHELLTTEFDLAVRLTVDGHDDFLWLGSERRFFKRERRLRYERSGTAHAVIPDYGFWVSHPSTDGQQPFGLVHLVEMDNGTMTLARIADKYRRYCDWSAADGHRYLQDLCCELGVRLPMSQFKLLIVAHDGPGERGDDQRLIDLFAQALDMPTSFRDRVWLTTAAALRAHQSTDRPLESPIWFRVRDARSWIANYRAQSCELRRSKRYARQRAFVASRITSLTRRRLFTSSFCA